MADTLRIAVTIGTPLALLAFIVALSYFAYARRMKFEEKKLDKLPPKELAKRTDEYLTRYGIDGKNLPVPDKLALIREEMDTRYKRQALLLVVSVSAVVLCFGISAIAYVIQPRSSAATLPDDIPGAVPESFPGFKSSKLPPLTDDDRQLAAYEKSLLFVVNKSDSAIHLGLSYEPRNLADEPERSSPYNHKVTGPIAKGETLQDYYLPTDVLGKWRGVSSRLMRTAWISCFGHRAERFDW